MKNENKEMAGRDAESVTPLHNGQKLPRQMKEVK